MKASPGARSKGKGFMFRLFVAGSEFHSKMAKDNLTKLCQAHINVPYQIETVDVLESHQTALENNIFLTPALIRVSPAPAITIFGDLSDTEEVIKALGLEGDE
jgi:circadian clock protein KaiB